MANQTPTFPRSYTLKLSAPTPDGHSDASTQHDKQKRLWQRLWNTHYAVNAGAKVFGELLLNLRGGLLPALATEGVARDHEKAKYEVKGRRRVLALGWFSVEDDHGAAAHAHRVKNVQPGASLSESRARSLLAETLKSRGVISEAEIAAWWEDCRSSLTARIRTDAVWVNRAEAFAAMRPAPTPEEARSILYRLCGKGLLTLKLVAAKSVRESDDDDEAGNKESELAKSVPKPPEPSNASRGVYGDLFGGESEGEKRARAEAKSGAAGALRKLLAGWDGRSDVTKLLSVWRTKQGYPKLDPATQGKFPPEVKSSGSPSTVARRYRKLLVFLGMWPITKDEDGSVPRAAGTTGDDRLSRTATLVHHLLDGCGENTDAESDDSMEVARVFHPEWADAAMSRIEKASGLSSADSSASEYRRLMFALAARRISQTHTWMKLNEAGRHAADMKACASREELAKLDPREEAHAWLAMYEQRRAESSGALEEFRITPRAVSGIDEVAAAWRGVVSADKRIEAIEEARKKVEKFGDAALFEDLAEATWVLAGKVDAAEVLKGWARLRKAEADLTRLRVPRFCHPDAFLHPTFVEYGGNSKPGIRYAWQNPSSLPNSEPGGDCDGSRLVWIKLPWSAEGPVRPCPFRWRSKRLWRDLGGSIAGDEHVAIPRGDRLSTAASSPEVKTSPARAKPSFPFSKDSKDWNARLEMSRPALKKLAKSWSDSKRDWNDSGKALSSSGWFLTFSPDLESADGPWRRHKREYAAAHAAVATLNKGRAFGACHLLSRLPCLRVLSVDLGHRYAAACAVWETLTEKQMTKACKEAGRGSPKTDDLCLHMAGMRAGKTIKTICRRTGKDMWARLDRQFTIKLQGEDEVLFEKVDPKSGRRMWDAVRRASPDENARVQEFETWLGFRPRPDDDPRPDTVKLVSRALRLARLGLRRHGDRARMAFYLNPKYKPVPGGKEALTEDTRRELLENALMLWQGLFSSPRWQDIKAKEMWRQHVRAELPLAPGEDASRAELKAYDKKVHELLPDYAAKLDGNTQLRKELHVLWATRWREDDKQWVAHLRWLRNWLLPHGRAKSDKSIRHVGGLSLDRLANIRELWQLMKARRTQPEPDDVRKNIPEKGDTRLDKFGQRVLDALEHMRDNRVKQLASRIVEAALGIGSEDRKHWQGGKRPRQLIADPRFAQCHAIVVENLDLYRPEPTRTRRENRQLMRWSAAKVLKFLDEACKLNNLHLRQVMPNYTSQQDSRTGAPGIRCTDMSVAGYLKQVERLKRRADGKEKEYLEEMEKACAEWPKTDKSGVTVRVPQQGGEVFVSADKDSPAAKGLQADLNAAANIGLRALFDPDWPGKWWYVPCRPKTFEPKPESVRGSEVFKGVRSLPVTEATKNAKAVHEYVNLWRQPTSTPAKDPEWCETKEYWAKVREDVVERLSEWADEQQKTKKQAERREHERELDKVPYEPRP